MGQGIRGKSLLQKYSPIHCASILFHREVFFHYPLKEHPCMQKKTLPLLLVPALLLTIVALMPSQALAASPHLSPHFYLKHGNAPLAGNLVYHGGPVMNGTANVYAIFWEPTSNVQINYNSLIQRYFGDVNGTGLYHNNTQYNNSAGRHPSQEHLVASWVDSGAYPESPLLDSDIQREVSHARLVNGWASSIHNIFFVFLQANENLCFDSSHRQCASNYFCAYHSYFGSNTIYAAMPYAASFSCNPGTSPNHNDADQTINVTSHEQMEAATDPLLNAWFDTSGSEIGDKCAWNFGPLNSSGGDVTWNGHSYIVQKEWDNHLTGCVLSGP